MDHCLPREVIHESEVRKARINCSCNRKYLLTTIYIVMGGIHPPNKQSPCCQSWSISNHVIYYLTNVLFYLHTDLHLYYLFYLLHTLTILFALEFFYFTHSLLYYFTYYFTCYFNHYFVYLLSYIHSNNCTHTGA